MLGIASSNRRWVAWLAVLAAAHAHDARGLLYEVFASDPVDGERVLEVRRDGAWQAVPVEAVVPGDVVRIRAGDIVHNSFSYHLTPGGWILDAGARAAVEITLESAKELRAALDRAIAAAEYEEAEVRGKGAPLRVVRAA